MPRHVWTVLCSNTSIDNQTNNISLFEVVEGLSLPGEAPADRDIALPVKLVLVTLWARSNPEVPEGGNGRFRFVAPDSRMLQTGEHELQLQGEYIRSRNLSRLEVIPLHGPGFYEYTIEYRTPNEADWVEVKRVPLEVRFEQGVRQDVEA